MVKDKEETDSDYKDRPHEYDSGPRRDSETWRAPLERVVFEVLRRGFEVGRGTLKQTDEALRDSAFAKDAAKNLAGQMGDLRQALGKIVGKEVENYLNRIDVASELRKALNDMTIEATVKFQVREPEKEPEEPESKP